MSEWAVRIESIILDNFKNVEHGEIHLANKSERSKASLLGLYGQNGSGKTALIDSIDILRAALSGRSIPAKYVDYINSHAQSASLKYCFSVKRKKEVYHAWYEFCIRGEDAREEYPSQNNEVESSGLFGKRLVIFNECLKFRYSDGTASMRLETLIDTKNGVFLPKSKYNELVGTEKDTLTDVLVAYKMAAEKSQSFIFSGHFINIIQNNCKNTIYLNLIQGLHNYGMRELFVINTDTSGLISLNALPIAFKFKKMDTRKETYGQLMIPLNETALVPVEMVEVVKDLMNNMNMVLEQIIPGLVVKIIELETLLAKDGQESKRLQLVSVRNGEEIPFRYESEGIKKIVSILQLLIVVYNYDSITLAIDEFDTGIFEYLLGEILRILSEKGRGQLIFTSHNLRPLETIGKEFIAFTTVNPLKRYIRFVNVKGNNNLRDFYYRDITLNDQAEAVYNPTNNYEIMLAFKEAGKAYGA